jgi:peptidoglycan/xylan/chitin deacetylase (PgdA/CDA1 family)
MIGAFMAGTHAPSRVMHPAKPSITPTPRIIALTFDDGPSSRYTPKILQLLTRYHAHATFFVLGTEVAQFPQIVKDIVKQGSAVGNHGYRHVNYFHVGIAGIERDAAEARALLKKDNIPLAPFYRPPFGNSNKRLVQALSRQGYTVTLWSIDTRDWSEPGVSYITKKVLTDASPGAIVLMHDGGGNRIQTVRALAAILPTLEADGYHFVTLPEYVKELHLKAPAKLPLAPTPNAPMNAGNQLF